MLGDSSMAMGEIHKFDEENMSQDANLPAIFKFIAEQNRSGKKLSDAYTLENNAELAKSAVMLPIFNLMLGGSAAGLNTPNKGIPIAKDVNLGNENGSINFGKPVPEEVIKYYSDILEGRVPKTKPQPEFHGGKEEIFLPKPGENIQSSHGDVLHTTPDKDFASWIIRNRLKKTGETGVVTEFVPFIDQNEVIIKSPNDALNLGHNLGLSSDDINGVVNRSNQGLLKQNRPINDPREFYRQVKELNASNKLGMPTKDIPHDIKENLFSQNLRDIGVDRIIKPAAGTQQEIINLRNAGQGNVINKKVLEGLQEKQASSPSEIAMNKLRQEARANYVDNYVAQHGDMPREWDIEKAMQQMFPQNRQGNSQLPQHLIDRLRGGK